MEEGYQILIRAWETNRPLLCPTMEILGLFLRQLVVIILENTVLLFFPLQRGKAIAHSCTALE
jgi:hypothetical protein